MQRPKATLHQISQSHRQGKAEEEEAREEGTDAGHLKPANCPPAAAERFRPDFITLDKKRILWPQQKLTRA